MIVPRHSTGDTSRLAALLLSRRGSLFSLVVSRQVGASRVSVSHATFTTDSSRRASVRLAPDPDLFQRGRFLERISLEISEARIDRESSLLE